MISFIFLMALYPDAQRKAQAEIDEVMGPNGARLPEVSELKSLPYLRAILKEVLRYAPVANIGKDTLVPYDGAFLMHPFHLNTALPHRVIREDEYQGFRIPKDATVIANVWYV